MSITPLQIYINSRLPSALRLSRRCEEESRQALHRGEADRPGPAKSGRACNQQLQPTPFPSMKMRNMLPRCMYSCSWLVCTSAAQVYVQETPRSSVSTPMRSISPCVAPTGQGTPFAWVTIASAPTIKWLHHLVRQTEWKPSNTDH